MLRLNHRRGNQIPLDSLLVVCDLEGEPLILIYHTSKMKVVTATSHGCREQDMIEGLEPFGIMFTFILFPMGVSRYNGTCIYILSHAPP